MEETDPEGKLLEGGGRGTLGFGVKVWKKFPLKVAENYMRF